MQQKLSGWPDYKIVFLSLFHINNIEHFKVLLQVTTDNHIVNNTYHNHDKQKEYGTANKNYQRSSMV